LSVKSEYCPGIHVRDFFFAFLGAPLSQKHEEGGKGKRVRERLKDDDSLCYVALGNNKTETDKDRKIGASA
jgi:hypothetical protein